MSRVTESLLESYTGSLRDALAGGGESALQRAYELGRRAVGEGLGVLDMAALHHEALRVLLAASPREQWPQTMAVAAQLYAESLSPFEMTHRGYQEANAALRGVNERLEAEAKRIAHILHDEAGQLLASVHLALSDLASDLPPARTRLQDVRGLLDQIELQLRRLSHELCPTILDDLGLVPALEFLAEGMSKRSGLPIVVEGSTGGRWPAAVETALYRIAQEALTNVLRHARATRARLRITQANGEVRCTIEDDGIGFDVEAAFAKKGDRGFGLIAIRDRVDSLGGQLRLSSSPGRGTELEVSIRREAYHG